MAKPNKTTITLDTPNANVLEARAAGKAAGSVRAFDPERQYRKARSTREREISRLFDDLEACIAAGDAEGVIEIESALATFR